MTRSRVVLTVVVLLPLPPVRAADDNPPRRTSESAPMRARRLAFMRGKLTEFVLQTDTDPPVPLNLADPPVLRWTNPVRGVDADGATFFWTRGGRPVAVATVSIRSEGKVFRELALLADEPLVAQREGRNVWSPRRNVYAFHPLDDAPTPARTPALRLTQLRALARRFRVSAIKGKPVATRLLTQPLARFEDRDAGILDGAVFSFAEGTDPEALLLLEARKDASHPDGRWFYSIARMTAPPLEVRLGDRLIWSCPGYWVSPRGPADAYAEAYLGVYQDEEPDDRRR